MNNKTDIEENIKTTKDFIEYAQEVINDMEYERPVDVTIYQKDIRAIENILADRERLEKENENWKKYNLEQEEHITDLNNKLFEAEAKANKYDSLVEKIKEKIELYKKLEIGSYDIDNIQADEYRAIIKVLQELLDTEKL